MLKHLQKWLTATRHTPAAKVVSCPLALEVLEPRTVFSAAPLAPAAIFVEHVLPAELAVEVCFFEIESTWLVVRSVPSDGEQARPQLPPRDVGEPVHRPFPIGEGEALRVEGAPVNIFSRLEPRFPTPEGERLPGSTLLVETVSRLAAVAPPLFRASVEPGPATSLLSQWNPPAATEQRENVLESSAASPVVYGGEKGRLASAANYQPSVISTGNLARNDADLAKSSRRLTESAALEEGGFIELDSLWKDDRPKRQGELSSSRRLIESEASLKRSISIARPTADPWRALPPMTAHESYGQRRAELANETRLPASGAQAALARAENEGGQIELPTTVSALTIASLPPSAGVPVPTRQRNNELDVGIGLYQAVELAFVPDENPATSESVAKDPSAIDATILLDALSQLLNVENLAGVVPLLGGRR